MIRRVLNAYLAEWLKFLHRAIGFAAFAAALVAVLLTAAFSRIGEAAASLEGGRRAVVAENGFLVLADCLGNGVGLGSIFLVIFAGLLLAEETELGTAKVVFSKPIRRREVVLAKGLLLLSLSVLLVAVVSLASYAVAHLFFGFRDIVAGGEVRYTFHTAEVMHGHALRAIPQLVPPLFAALAVAFLMSALARQSGIAVGLSFAALTVSAALTWLFDRAAPFLVTSYFSFATDTLRAFAAGEATAQWGVRWPKGPPKLLLGLVVCAGYAFLAWAVAAAAVAKRPILGLLLAFSIGGATVLGGAGEARAADRKPSFDVTEHAVQGQVWEVEAADLDRDGHEDLVVFHVSGRKGPDPHRYLSLFFGRKEAPPPGERGKRAAFASGPDQTIEVPGDACVRFLAELDASSPGLELGFIGTRGAFYYRAAGARRYDPKSRQALFFEPCFFDIAAGTQLPSWEGLVRDVDGDGLADVVYPMKGSFGLFTRARGGAPASGPVLERTLELPLEYHQNFGTRIETLLLNRFLNYKAKLARPALADLDGDGRLDLATLRGDGFDLFVQRPAKSGAMFARDPDARLALKVMSAESAQEDESFNSVNADLVDVDGDRRSDLILFRNMGKVGLFSTMYTQILFHRSREKGFFPEAPDQVLNLKGVSINPALIDVDRDGTKDLVVSSLRTDLMTNAKRALFQSVTVTYYVFRYRKDEGRFGASPDYARDLSIDIERLDGGGTIPLALLWGDYDGDRYPDLLSLESSERVAILPGRFESSFFGGESLDYDEGRKTTVDIETSNSIEIFDVDRDGRSDFVFWYFDANWESKERGTIRVVMSR